jgi:hypothetical protein
VEWLEAEVQAELHQAGLLIQEAVRRRRREQIRQQEAAVEAHRQEAAAAARRAEAEAAARRVEEDLHLRNKRDKQAQRRRVRFRLPTDR